MYNKGFALAIIILFVGVSFQPILALEPSEKVTFDDEKIEYTIQIIKTNNVIENKVYLTKQQADELENLIDDIRADLFNSESEEETNKIYNDAINSFNNLELFPKDVTVDEINQLVNRKSQKLNSIKFKNEISVEFKNSLCYVSGESSMTFFLRPSLFLLSIIIGFIWSPVSLYIFVGSNPLFRIRIGDVVFFGETEWYSLWYPEPINYWTALGWIYTVGKNGIKSYNGSFSGNLGHRSPYDSIYVFYPGILGFTGIQISKSSYGATAFYMGNALKVAIRY